MHGWYGCRWQWWRQWRWHRRWTTYSARSFSRCPSSSSNPSSEWSTVMLDIDPLCNISCRWVSFCLSACLFVYLYLSLSVSLRHMCKTTTDRKQVSLDATPLKCMPPHSHICTHMTLTVDLCPRKAFRPTHMLITCAKFHLNPSIMWTDIVSRGTVLTARRTVDPKT